MGRAQLPIRIYTLAKELKIDNKKLVDVCTSAGIKGKGSALASLSDEELATLKAYHGGRASGSRATGAGAGRPPAADAAAPVPGFSPRGLHCPGQRGRRQQSAGVSPKADKPAGKKKPAEEGSAERAPRRRERKKEREKQPALKLAPLPTAVRPRGEVEGARSATAGHQAPARTQFAPRARAASRFPSTSASTKRSGRRRRLRRRARRENRPPLLLRNPASCPRPRPPAASGRAAAPASPSRSWRRRRRGPPPSADASSGN